VQIELGVAALTAVAVTALGGAGLVAVNRRVEARRARERALADELERSQLESFGERGLSAPRFVGVVQRVGEAVGAKQSSGGLRQNLARAGYFHPSAAAVYLGAKMLFLVLGVAVFGLASAAGSFPSEVRIGLTVVGSLLFFFVPNVVVSSRRDRRKRDIQRHLPDAIDLLEICVTAGMGLDTAWKAVASDIRRVSATLADEMELTNLEISLGASRAVAMRHMADRTGVEEISSLVALLVQSDRFGASIVDSLRVFAKTMREIRQQRAEESAEKMAVLMLFPMVLFIFPALLIVMVGPAALEIFRNMVNS
jgi:tight adherence protein C